MFLFYVWFSEYVDFNLFCWSVSLENILVDISELDKGMEMTKKEYEARKDRDPPVMLKDFLANSEDKIKKLKVDAKSSQVQFWTVFVSEVNCIHSFLPVCS